MENAAPTFTPLSPVIGMQVKGIDLAKPLPKKTVDRLVDELSNHSILLFRSQKLTDQQLIDASRYFGDLEPHVADQFNLPDHPEILVVSNIVENGREIGARGGAKHWHSDYSYRDLPSLGSLFYCLEKPAEGGQTQFASMYSAFERLSEEQKTFLKSARAVHDYNHYWTTYTKHRPPLTPKQLAEVPPVAHPALRTHPVNGRPAIYICQHVVSHFEGIPYDESQKIVEEVVGVATDPKYVYTHEWEVGDVLFWDNRSSMHRVCEFDEDKYRRRMHRTTITGDRPFYKPVQAAAE